MPLLSGKSVFALRAICAALSLLGVTVALVAFERWENIPAWRAHPEDIKRRWKPNGLMSDDFAKALFESVITENDYRLIGLVAEGKGSADDKRSLARFLERYLAKAHTLGIDRTLAERQFFWSATGCYDKDERDAVGRPYTDIFEGAVKAYASPERGISVGRS